MGDADDEDNSAAEETLKVVHEFEGEVQISINKSSEKDTVSEESKKGTFERYGNEFFRIFREGLPAIFGGALVAFSQDLSTVGATIAVLIILLILPIVGLVIRRTER